jgi:hypothetical protein
MGYPGIQILLAEEGQIGADHMRLGVCSFFVWYDAVKVPPIIMCKRLVVPVDILIRRQAEKDIKDSNVPWLMKVLEHFFVIHLRNTTARSLVTGLKRRRSRTLLDDRDDCGAYW